MKKTFISIGITACLIGVAVLTNTAFAAATTSSTTPRRVTPKLDQTIARLQQRADKEIDRRVTALNKLQTKIQGMVKVTAPEKSTFTNTVQGQINLLNNLKIKINADTDAATIKADVQSITKAYRIYALVLPQIEIVAAADKLASTTGLLTTLQGKLQARITAVQASSTDITALQALITDMSAKIADANSKSAAAIAAVQALVPDNGVKTVMTANTTALKVARDMIKTGTKDVKDAQNDANKIRKGLNKSEGIENATTTATTTSH